MSRMKLVYPLTWFSPKGLNSLLLCLLSVCAIYLFATRDIPLTADDIYYANHFSYYRPYGQGLWKMVIEEPLFTLLSNTVSIFENPIFYLRLLIILTMLPHAYYAWTLESWRKWVYFTGYLIIVHMAAYLSYVQLRQGLSLAVFLLLTQLIRKRYASTLAALIASLIHSSMFSLSFALLVPKTKRRLLYIGLSIIAMALVVIDLSGISNYIANYGLLGRREIVYLGELNQVSPLFYLYSFVLLVYVSYFTSDANAYNSPKLIDYHVLFSLCFPMFFLSTFASFAERMFYFVRWYELWLVSNSNRRNARNVAVGYLGLNMAYTIYHGFRYYGQGGYFDRILSLF